MKKSAAFFLTLFTLSLVNCGGGGGDDDGGSASGDVCSLKIFQGTLCSSSTDSVVELIFKDSSGQPFSLCTGSLITSNTVLTAAHCFDLGSNGGIDVTSGGVTASASRSLRHPLYSANDNLTPYDVAIIYLNSPLPGDTLPIRASRSAFDGENIRIFGYGQDESGSTLFEQGIRGTGPKAGQSEIAFAGDGIFVAGNPNQGLCSGDSGGPATAGFDADSAIIGVSQAGVFVEGCSDSKVTRSDIEQIQGRPLTDDDLESLLPLSDDGGETFSVNFYSDVSFPPVTDFITANVPGVELR